MCSKTEKNLVNFLAEKAAPSQSTSGTSQAVKNGADE